MTNRKLSRSKERATKFAVLAMIVSAVLFVWRMDAQDEIAKNDPCVYFQK